MYLLSLKTRQSLTKLTILITLQLLSVCIHAGEQKYEPLAASVRAALHKAIADKAVTDKFADKKNNWLLTMSKRLNKRMSNPTTRQQFLQTVYYEAKRAGLDPQLVLALIQVESAFRKYAISSAGARGYMQVMPFWLKLIGRPSDNLFNLRTNLRYGCTILRHYLDIENGNLYRALGRYNGSLGKAKYPNLVRSAWQNVWHWQESKAPHNMADTKAAFIN